MNNQKIPPQSLDTEKSVLGSCIVSKDALEIAIEALSPDDFYTIQHRKIFIAIQNLYNLDLPVDIVTLPDELEKRGLIDEVGGVAYISHLIEDISTSTMPKKWCDILITKRKLRNYIQLFTEASNNCFSNDANPEKIISSVDYKLIEIVNNDKKYETVHIKDVVPEFYKNIEDRKKGKTSGITTGFKTLDEKMGVYENGDLYIIAARPSMGKSSFMLNSAYAASAITKTPVLVFSLEMSRQKLATRLISSESRVDSDKIRHGKLSKIEFNQISIAGEAVCQSGVWVNDDPRLNIYQIRTICNRMKRKYDIGLVLIDYLQMVAETGEKDGKPQETALISNVGKVIAKDLNIPVVELSQLDRNVEKRHDKRPMLSDLRWSGDIEQDADVVLFLYRPWVYNKKEDPQKTELIIAKNRDGNTGILDNFVFEKEITTFRELSENEIENNDFTIENMNNEAEQTEIWQNKF